MWSWHVWACVCCAPYSNFWSKHLKQKLILIYSQAFQPRENTSSKMNMRWNQNNSSSVQRRMTGRLSICQHTLLKWEKNNNGRHQLSSGMGCLSYYWLKINNYVRLRTVRRNWGSKIFMFLVLKCKIDNGDTMLKALINQIKWNWLGIKLYYMMILYYILTINLL